MSELGPLRPERAVAAFDSASAMVRATALALRGKGFADLGRGVLRSLPVEMSALQPESRRRRAYALLGGSEGIPVNRLGDVDMEAVAEWVVGHYTGDRYPGVVIGSSNGAAVHLCAATGMPMLPQTLLVPVRRPGGDPDRPDEAMEFGRRVAPDLLDRNPKIVLHHMHDGNQDRLMASRMTYFRLKWTMLPDAYARFLRERLEPGAPVVVLADESVWPTTRVDDRHVFQTGARGGLTVEEYLWGSPRVARFLRACGSAYDRFQAPEPDDTSPEAEWGFAPGLAASIEAMAGPSAHPVVTVRAASPQALSAPVAQLLRARLRSDGVRADRLVVESFVMLEPVHTLRGGAVPYWTVFGVEPALAETESYLSARQAAGDPYEEIDVLLFPHGLASAGAAAPDQWMRLARHASAGRVRMLTGTVQRWPAHFDALARYGPALRRARPQIAAQPRLTVAAALNFLIEWGVRVDGWPIDRGATV